MKKLYPAILFFAALPGFGQLTQANHAPANGESYQMWDCGTSANPGAAGSGVTWNFSALVTNSSTSVSYAAFTTTASGYPSANVTLSASTNNISHYKSSSASLLYYGGNISVSSVQGVMTYTDPAIEGVYPMSMSSTSSTPISGTVNVQPFNVPGSFTGSSNVIADGTGTLVLPGGGTYTNATRVVTSQTIFITSLTNATVQQQTFNYYTVNIKAPVVSIMTATATLSGSSPNTQTVVMRNQNALGVITSTVNTGITGTSGDVPVQVFPNPASGALKIKSALAGQAFVSLFDLTGKLVMRTAISEGGASLDVSPLHRGLYIYRIGDLEDRSLATGKLAVDH